MLAYLKRYSKDLYSQPLETGTPYSKHMVAEFPVLEVL
jgi:hypothetical protein